MKRILFLLIFSLGLLSRAQAHAFLDHAMPRVGSTGPSPATVKLWMTEELEPAFCRIQVLDGSGHEVDRHDAKISGATMTLSLPALAPGTYKVAWKAIATDTHKTTGTFTFTVQ
jgi:methionine-rich copper-binding protein CopC